MASWHDACMVDDTVRRHGCRGGGVLRRHQDARRRDPLRRRSAGHGHYRRPAHAVRQVIFSSRKTNKNKNTPPPRDYHSSSKEYTRQSSTGVLFLIQGFRTTIVQDGAGFCRHCSPLELPTAHKKIVINVLYCKFGTAPTHANEGDLIYCTRAVL